MHSQRLRTHALPVLIGNPGINDGYTTTIAFCLS